ncbi:MAG: hypothetical protein A4E58_02216 [Syntrophorhabdus sp. PtaB.Bin006]|nr:MAG: hypothetical protein A4E58_02216 [Syntrophorhabdus sp. PtaB.Bin006]
MSGYLHAINDGASLASCVEAFERTFGSLSILPSTWTILEGQAHIFQGLDAVFRGDRATKDKFLRVFGFNDHGRVEIVPLVWKNKRKFELAGIDPSQALTFVLNARRYTRDAPGAVLLVHLLREWTGGKPESWEGITLQGNVLTRMKKLVEDTAWPDFCEKELSQIYTLSEAIMKVAVNRTTFEKMGSPNQALIKCMRGK